MLQDRPSLWFCTACERDKNHKISRSFDWSSSCYTPLTCRKIMKHHQLYSIPRMCIQVYAFCDPSEVDVLQQ